MTSRHRCYRCGQPLIKKRAHPVDGREFCDKCIAKAQFLIKHGMPIGRVNKPRRDRHKINSQEER